MTKALTVFFLVSIAATGCDESDEPSSEMVDAAAQPDATAGDAYVVNFTPTYHRDVAPILGKNCVGCHQEGGIGPFALGTFENASRYASVIAVVTAARQMPPWLPDNSGACNTYQNARWLTEEEIAILGAWNEGGRQEGDVADARTLPVPVAQKVATTHTLDIGAPYAPNQALLDDYRCFVLDAPAADDRFLTAYEVKPGDKRVVHHVILYTADSDKAQAKVMELDAKEPGPGYTCFGGTGAGDENLLAGWAPGTGVTRYPEGTGIKVTGKRKLVLQIHYNLANGGGSDRTTLDLELVPSVAQQAFVSPVADVEMNVAPGQKLVTTTATFPSRAPVKVWAVFPHMHTIGRTLRVDYLEKDGTNRCMVDVKNFNFAWQQFHMYTQPLTVKSGKVTITCGYDTSGRSEAVKWGEGTADEMCLNYFYVTAPL